MKKSIKVLILLFSVSIFAQSPWTKEKGKFYTQLSFSVIPNYNSVFGDPDFVTNGEITDRTLQFYGEYGLSNKISLIVSLPFKMISINDYENPAIDCGNNCFENFEESSLGNFEIGLKHNFYNKNWLISGQFSLEANTGSYNEVSGIRTGIDAYTFTPMLIAGKGFNNYYIQSYLGTKLRTNDYSSSLKIGGEYGYKVRENLWLIGFVDIEKSFENGDVKLPNINTQNSLYVNNQEYGVFGLKAIGEFSENLGITFGFPFAFFGNNVPKQATPTIGVYSKF